MRKFSLYVDGVKAGEITDGAEESFEVTAGEHTLKAKVDWCGSPEVSFHVQENETKTFYLSGYKYASLISKIALAIFAVHLILKYTIDFSQFIYVFIPFALYPVYFLTFGRNRYLRLSEEFEV